EFTMRGPDVNGQTRVLRTADGVHFTKAGARKLAHYIERDFTPVIRDQRTPAAIPAGPSDKITPKEERPIAGPVVPLTGKLQPASDLAGRSVDNRQADTIANRVLLDGEPLLPPKGRADDFTWPRSKEEEKPDSVKTNHEAPTHVGRSLKASRSKKNHPPRSP
ncbi:MAG TPA: DUF459 domain-containing protein, partial [Xanthobacteraceae bacterium]|nr:DUF459 domain-containing protein [Xanthobacteraceae bacterium]